ncbi:MAG: YqgE/AlgH family protein [Legionella sp.]|nr:YqgE/AlgH family protein [Legionella sp.]
MNMHALLSNHVLIAMPSLFDTSFKQAVIYICEHQVHGTVGLIVNRPTQHPLKMVFEQMHIDNTNMDQNAKPVLFGGPMQQERGFVLHRPTGHWRTSTPLNNEIAVTTSSDILHALAAGEGPKDSLVMLGYVGWDESQLEKEVMNNNWLICPYRAELLYEVPFEKRWEYAASTIGVKIDQLASGSGHA